MKGAIGRRAKAVAVIFETQESHSAELEEVSGFGLVCVPRMDPATYGPSGELPSSHVNTTLELACKEIRNGGLARCLYSGHEPHAV